ncbi:MAG: hypothetical protein U0Z53_01780 [Blastocatellia bacterium]
MIRLTTSFICLLTLCLLFVSGTGQTSASPTREQAEVDRTPEAVIRAARVIFIHARSDFFDREALERELLNQPDFRRWGLAITTNREEADLIAEVTRKKLTTRFTIRLIDAQTRHVLLAVEASSLGGEIEPHLARNLVKQLKPYLDKKE